MVDLSSSLCKRLPEAASSWSPELGEDTTQAMLEPPESSGVHTTDAVNKAGSAG